MDFCEISVGRSQTNAKVKIDGQTSYNEWSQFGIRFANLRRHGGDVMSENIEVTIGNLNNDVMWHIARRNMIT